MTCPNCDKEVLSSTKYCEHCGKNLENNIIVKNDNSFNKHLFNWKFYIAPILIGIFSGFLYNETGNIKSVAGIIIIVSIIMTIKYKSTLMKRFAMFVTSYITIGFTFIAVSMLSLSVAELIYNKGNNQIISTILLNNKNLPKMINKEIEQMPYKQVNQNEISAHYKYINYTKDEILHNYNNNIILFEKKMLQDELKSSCSTEGVKDMLANGLKFNINYYDKNTQLVGIIFLNKERCRPYYK